MRSNTLVLDHVLCDARLEILGESCVHILKDKGIDHLCSHGRASLFWDPQAFHATLSSALSTTTTILCPW